MQSVLFDKEIAPLTLVSLRPITLDKMSATTWVIVLTNKFKAILQRSTQTQSHPKTHDDVKSAFSETTLCESCDDDEPTPRASNPTKPATKTCWAIRRRLSRIRSKKSPPSPFNVECGSQELLTSEAWNRRHRGVHNDEGYYWLLVERSESVLNDMQMRLPYIAGVSSNGAEANPC